ncbi:Craniofacial development protein 1 [Geodia barretti]|uniref:Craniofacial development protein 1 n=1 Tax=Geodia barretti TaxID=519541 RepID=A0AA35RXP6_GEOBA|nr:Craniofacial development protein 1 [Geodia barretti]
MADSDASSDPEDLEYIPEGDGERSESEQSVAGEEEEEEKEDRRVSTSSITTRSSQRTSTITVEQEVSADSVEAKQFVSEQDITSATTTATVSDPQPTSSSSSTSSTAVTGVGASSTGTASGPLPSGKKRSGISSVLQSLAKKPKMSTLEKSQLDWNRFKAEEGLEHELTQQRKDGYLEKQEFLQRTDWRQYELEREERLKKFNRLH